jgi:hypothetical protein
MKTSTFIFAIFLLIFINYSCEDRITETRTFKANVPIYMTSDELKATIKITGVTSIENPGKIYFKDNYVFINEIKKGVHIFDNKDPRKPIEVAFIEIPSNVDIAIKGNILYADNLTDLIALDIKDLKNIKEVARISGVFSNYNWVDKGYDYQLPCTTVDYTKGIITGWKQEVVTEKVINHYGYEDSYKYELALSSDFSRNSSSSAMVSPNPTGQGGSMARFVIQGNYLYTINDGWALQVFDIAKISSPVKGEMIYTNANIETLFLYDNKIFIGSTTGMFIYDLLNPAKPSLFSQFLHVRSCDPVVVQDNYAYVTLRSGTTCQGFTNQLDVLDISDLAKPKLVKSYPMKNPHGLGIENNILFICDGDAGLKIYNASDPYGIDQNLIQQFPDIHAFDVIPLQGILLMIGDNGFYQYSYKDLKNIELLSTIPIVKKNK